jgi:GNAT superfamily N-acetyltransferase
MIRQAATDEASVLTTIAFEAKRYWGYPEDWIRHWESDLTISPEFVREHHVYVAEADGEIRGFYALCVSGAKAELEHMWVRPAWIGTGVGKELFLDAMERAAALEVSDVGITADPNAVGFYRRMGATQVGDTDAPVAGEARKLPRLKITPQ